MDKPTMEIVYEEIRKLNHPDITTARPDRVTLNILRNRLRALEEKHDEDTADAN